MIRRQFLGLGLSAFVLPARARPAATVAAASDLKFALDEVVADYAKATGEHIRVTYGSSGNFARQIEQGAPFDLFMSADEDFVRALSARGLTLDDGTAYAVGRIVLFASNPPAFGPDPAMKGLAAALDAGRIRRFALANPEHAPYGRAAREALQAAGIWPAIEPRLVFGENVSQAAQFAAGGNTEGGIFALSLALVPGIASRGAHVVLPETLHRPLRQRMVLMRRAGPQARAFHRYLTEPAAQQILRRYGFRLPEK